MFRKSVATTLLQSLYFVLGYLPNAYNVLTRTPIVKHINLQWEEFGVEVVFIDSNANKNAEATCLCADWDFIQQKEIPRSPRLRPSTFCTTSVYCLSCQFSNFTHGEGEFELTFLYVSSCAATGKFRTCWAISICISSITRGWPGKTYIKASLVGGQPGT